MRAIYFPPAIFKPSVYYSEIGSLKATAIGRKINSGSQAANAG